MAPRETVPSPETTLVRQLMTKDPLVLMADDSIDIAERFMEFAHIRHLPVVDGEHVVGLVTHRDILRASISLLTGISRQGDEGIKRGIPVVEIMRKDVSTIAPDTDVRAAIDTMLDHKYGCLPVTQEGRLVGILTEADFLKFAEKWLDDNPT